MTTEVPHCIKTWHRETTEQYTNTSLYSEADPKTERRVPKLKGR